MLLINLCQLVASFFFIIRPKWVLQNGKRYQKGDVVLVGEKDELPQFGEILQVLVEGPNILFHISVLLTLEFVDNFHAYKIQRQSGHTYLILSSDLDYDNHPYVLYQPCSVFWSFYLLYCAEVRIFQ